MEEPPPKKVEAPPKKAAPKKAKAPPATKVKSPEMVVEDEEEVTLPTRLPFVADGNNKSKSKLPIDSVRLWNDEHETNAVFLCLKVGNLCEDGKERTYDDITLVVAGFKDEGVTKARGKKRPILALHISKSADGTYSAAEVDPSMELEYLKAYWAANGGPKRWVFSAAIKQFHAARENPEDVKNSKVAKILGKAPSYAGTKKFTLPVMSDIAFDLADNRIATAEQEKKETAKLKKEREGKKAAKRPAEDMEPEEATAAAEVLPERVYQFSVIYSSFKKYKEDVVRIQQVLGE